MFLGSVTARAVAGHGSDCFYDEYRSYLGTGRHGSDQNKTYLNVSSEFAHIWGGGSFGIGMAQGNRPGLTRNPLLSYQSENSKIHF